MTEVCEEIDEYCARSSPRDLAAPGQPGKTAGLRLLGQHGVLGPAIRRTQPSGGKGSLLGALGPELCHSSIHSSALPTDASAAHSSSALMHRPNLGPCTDIFGKAVRYAAAVSQLSRAALDELVAEAVVDAYNDDEQLTGLYTMIEENLAMPFETTVLGVEVTVRRIDLQAEGIVAICQRGRARQAIEILDLPLPDPAPQGAQWIAAYRHWLGDE
jgi:hypothetical protein